MILRKKNPSSPKSLILNKFKSMSQIGATGIIGVSIVCLSAAVALVARNPIVAEGFENKGIDCVPQASVILVKDVPKAVLIIANKPDIVPGESTTQREVREKAEAEALAQAEAIAAKKQKVSRDVVSRERRVYADPSDFEAVYKAAGAKFGVDPILLHAIHFVETGCSGSTSKSNPSGATGPMQFLPSTFRHHAVDGNADGLTDVHNLEDAVFTAAAYLRACGYPNVKQALYGYNPSYYYYLKVMDVARTFGYQG